MFLTEDTVFNRCSSSTEGGSIKYGSYGQFSQQRVCSYRSKTSSEGVFCQIRVSNPFYNKIFDSSISFSGDESQQGKYNIHLIGNINISNINSSFAKIDGRSLFHFSSIASDSILSQSTFSNNSQSINAGSYYSSQIYGTSSTPFSMQSCNFLNNTGSQNTYSALIYSSPKLSITNSSFIGNTVNTYKFWISSGSITVEFCYIKDEQGDYGSPIYYKNKIVDQSTALLSHFETFECLAKLPLSIKPKHYKTEVMFPSRILDKITPLITIPFYLFK